jgi:hypothetical protein
MLDQEFDLMDKDLVIPEVTTRKGHADAQEITFDDNDPNAPKKRSVMTLLLNPYKLGFEEIPIYRIFD